MDSKWSIFQGRYEILPYTNKENDILLDRKYTRTDKIFNREQRIIKTRMYIWQVKNWLERLEESKQCLTYEMEDTQNHAFIGQDQLPCHRECWNIADSRNTCEELCVTISG